METSPYQIPVRLRHPQLSTVCLTVILGLFWVPVFGQDAFLVLERGNLRPVPFAELVSVCDGRTYQAGADGTLHVSNKLNDCQEWQIRQVAYLPHKLSLENLLRMDTIFLEPVVFQLPTVSVTETSVDWHEKVEGMILARKRMKTPAEDHYNYLLQSSISEKEVERIEAELIVGYAPATGFQLGDNYAVAGDFWHAPDAIFLNQQTEHYLLGLAPFVSEKRKDASLMFQERDRRKNLSYHEVACADCAEGEVLLNFRGEAGEGSLRIDTLRNVPRKLEIVDTPENPETFKQITNGGTVTLSERWLSFTYSDKGEKIGKLAFRLRFRLPAGDTVATTGSLTLADEETDYSNQQCLVLGDYVADNLYETLLLRARRPTSDRTGLNSFSPALRRRLLQQPNPTNAFRFWSPGRLVGGNDFVFRYAPEPYYRRRDGAFVNVTNEIGLNWMICLEQTDRGIMVDSEPACWNRQRSARYATVNDSLYADLYANLLFDLYEYRRRAGVDSLRALAASGTTLADIKQIANKLHDEALAEVTELGEAASGNRLGFAAIEGLQSEFSDPLGADNFAPVFAVELRDREQDPDYTSMLENTIALAHRTERRDESAATAMFRRAIPLYRQALAALERESPTDPRELASLYHRMAEAYYHVNDYENACSCIRRSRELWPEGFAAAARYNKFNRKQFLKENCGG